MRKIGVIQIFVQLCHGLIHRFSKQINLGTYGKGLAHLHLAAGSPTHVFGRIRSRFVQKLQIRNRHLGTQDPHLYGDVAL